MRGLDSEFSFSYTGGRSKVNVPNQTNYLFIAEVCIV